MAISLTAVDRLSLSFIALLAVIALLFVPDWHSTIGLFGTYAALSLAILCVSLYRARIRAQKKGFYAHVVFTIILIFLLFNSLGELIAGIHSRTFDDLLIRIDFAVFGVHPTLWMERFINPFLTAVLQLAYISYYCIPVALGVTLIAKGRYADFEKALFGIVLCFYLSYIGYLLVPAVGPRFTLDELQTTGLQAGPLISGIQETLNTLEQNKTDAFPSGHTAIAVLTLFYAWKLREKTLSTILVPVVLALMVSTVYLRYHYVVDVIAGIPLAALTVCIAPALRSGFSGASAQPGNERHRDS